ncbi:MAG TPA: hypothetical protein EYP36_10855 [Calditrichaeota bacterium]|nr:hypothetical protein [Calditrichota bacterium]
MRNFIILLLLSGILNADSLPVFPVYGKQFSFPLILVNYGESIPLSNEVSASQNKNELQPLNCWPGTCLYVGNKADTLTEQLQVMNNKSQLFSIKPISSLLIPQGYALQTDSIFREKFYSERQINPFILSFTNNRNHRPQQEQTNRVIPVHLLQTERVSKKLEIYDFERKMGSDFLFFKMEHTLYEQLSVAEVLLFSEFIDWFFNTQLIPAGTKIHYKIPSFYVLSSPYFPVYLPEVTLITDRNTVINILSNWSRIVRRSIIEITSDEIVKLRDELVDKLITIKDSPLGEAVFVNKLALKSGRIITPRQLTKQLRIMNLDEAAKRFKLLIEQEWIDLHWDTTQKVNSDLLKKLHTQFKLTVYSNNKITKGQER